MSGDWGQRKYTLRNRVCLLRLVIMDYRNARAYERLGYFSGAQVARIRARRTFKGVVHGWIDLS